MNPYETLGIPPTASEQQIKSAYRRRARETHPDAGGDGDEFSQVSRAYAILIDPEMRKRFDETGSIEDGPAPLTVRQRMIQIIADLFSGGLVAANNHGMPLKQFNLVNAMRQQIGESSKLVKDNARKQRQALTDRQFMLKRITRKGDGQNLFADIIREQIVKLEPVVKQAELDVLAIDMAAEELLHYENEVELIQAMQMMQYGGNYSTNNASTARSVWIVR